MGSKRNPNQLPGTYEQRVFVGGNYNVAGNLRAIKRYVEAANFIPIFPLDDYEIPLNEIHDWDIRLLHNCRYAIFDVSVPAGELMEIERAITFRTKTLLLFQIKNPGQTAPEQVASMLRTSGHRLLGYRDPSDESDLGRIVSDFLLEDTNVDLYQKVFGYEVDEVYDSYIISADGSAVRTCEQRRLKGNVTHIFHRTTTTLGEIVDINLVADRKIPMKWVLDRDRSKQPNHKEGHIIFPEGLKVENGPVGYSLSCKLSPGSVCLTKEDIDKQYAGDLLPYETCEREVIFPIRKLILEVKFFAGYKVVVRPTVFNGSEQLLEAVRPRLDEFILNQDSNSAIFKVTRPKMFHNYIIHWMPVV